MKIVVYDGASTIGGSKIHIEEGDNGLFLDFGMNFAKYSSYYEEFISERTTRGKGRMMLPRKTSRCSRRTALR